MTEETIKELLSQSYLRILANNAGFNIRIDEKDYGVDIAIGKVGQRPGAGGSTRFYTTGETIDIQLKATTIDSVEFGNDSIAFDLKVNNYNDLVIRRNEGITPLILILHVFPNERDQWINYHETELRVRRNAFWFRPDEGAEVSNNASTKRIHVPIANTVDIARIDSLFDEFL